MHYLIEEFYNVIEEAMVTWFLISYFQIKNKHFSTIIKIIAYLLILISANIISIFNFNWISSFVFFSVSLFGVLSLFFKGTLTERIIISFTATLLLAICDICTLTMIGKMLNVNYQALVENNNFSRFLCVLSSKFLYVITASIILFFKKKYTFLLQKRELLLMITVLLLSIIQISLIRNIIYEQQQYYNIFMVVLLCVVMMNIVIYYTMIYISKRNVDETNYSLMKKQIELQKESIQALEQKYDETAKIRHDLKNYMSCALNMAEQEKYTELIQFLQTLSDEKINSVKSYVNTKRSVMGAVLNTKLSKAQSKKIDMQCYILSEFDNISDADLGIILANLLDNAIEACEKNQYHSEIIVKTWIEAGYYFLEISNTVEMNVLSNNPMLKTNKNDVELHGIGLRSVRDIVEKYDGMISFDQKGNIFHVYVSLEKNSS